MADNKELKENIQEQGGKPSKQKEKGISMEILSMFKNVLIAQWIIIGVLILIIAAQSFYHDYKWSKYETVVVDSGDGGNAGYVGNDGDVNNYGKDSGSEKEEPKGQPN